MSKCNKWLIHTHNETEDGVKMLFVAHSIKNIEQVYLFSTRKNNIAAYAKVIWAWAWSLDLGGAAVYQDHGGCGPTVFLLNQESHMIPIRLQQQHDSYY